MKITPETKKVYELFPIQGKRCYAIPTYQRNYSWKNEQIEQLFTDVLEEGRGYYIGNLLVTDSSDKDAFDVIDGQQRLTTISLFYLAMAHELKEYKRQPSIKDDEDLCDEIASKIQDIKRQLRLPGCQEPRISLLPHDQKIYRDLMESVLSTKKDPVKRWGNRILSRRYEFICSLFEEVLTTPRELLDYFDKLNDLEVLQIEVPDIGDAFNVFSSLNSKGLPLTLIDLLKGEFISVGSNGASSAEKVLAQWEKLTELFAAQDADVDNRLVTQFLLNNYDAFEGTGSAITKGRALSEYRKVIKEHYRNHEDYLDILLLRAKAFAQLTGNAANEMDDHALEVKIAALQKLESTQALPLLLFLFVNKKELGIVDHLVDIADMLISFYVRRNITLTPKSSNIRSFMLSTLREIREQNLRGQDVVKVVCDALAAHSASDEIFAASLDEGIYDKNKKTTRYVLIDIERRKGGSPLFNKQHPDSLDDFKVKKNGKNHPRWSIEHILPEGSLPSYWCSMIAPGEEQDAGEIQSEHVHRLGNLTLTPYNPELGQKPFYCEDDPEQKSKRDYKAPDNGEYVGLRSGLFLNRSIADEAAGEALENKETWTVEDIDRRNEILKRYVLELYKVPEVNSAE